MVADCGSNSLSSRRGVECNTTPGGRQRYCTFIAGHRTIACVAGSSLQAATRPFNTCPGFLTLANRSHTLAFELGSGSNLGLLITHQVTDKKETRLRAGDGGFSGKG
jgi:hypothetical protein